jgi:hypothetical protein
MTDEHRRRRHGHGVSERRQTVDQGVGPASPGHGSEQAGDAPQLPAGGAVQRLRRGGSYGVVKTLSLSHL